MERLDIYKYKNDYELEIKRLKKAKISSNNKEIIKRFHNHLFANGCSNARVIKLSAQLRKLAGWIDKDFDQLIKEDVETIVVRLNKDAIVQRVENTKEKNKQKDLYNKRVLSNKMAFKHPHRYGLMAMVRKKDYKFLEKYKAKLKNHIRFFMEPHFFDDIAPQHISVCYFSYPEKYPEEFVAKLVPKINEIAKKYLPLKVKVKGLLGGWELNLGVPAILWNITDMGVTKEFHEKIIEALKGDIEHFNDPEMDFTPHIGIALGKEEDIEELKKIVKESKDDPEIEITMDKIYIFYPDGPKKVFDTE